MIIVKTGISQDIFQAARTGDTQILLELYNLNEDTLESVNSHGFTPLIIACYQNQEASVNFLIKKNVNVNQSSQEGTALLGASYKGNISIVKILLNAGAEVNTANSDGITPLIFSVLTKNIEMAELLLTFDANPLVTDNKNLSAIDYAKKMELPEFVEIFE